MIKENRIDDPEIYQTTHSFHHSFMCYASVILLSLPSCPQEQTSPFTSSQLFTFHPCIEASSSFVICLASFSPFHISAFLFSILSKIATLPPLFPILVMLKMCPQISSMRVIWQLVRKANFQDHPKPTELERDWGRAPAILCFNKPLKWFWCTLHFENHCSILLSSFI